MGSISKAKHEAHRAMVKLWKEVSLGQDWTDASLKKQSKIARLWKQIERVVDK